MAKLVGNADLGMFYKLGDWHVYKYYMQVQKGLIMLAGAMVSNCYNLYMTQEADKGLVHILSSTCGQMGSYPIVVSSIGSIAMYQGKSLLHVLVKEILYKGGHINNPITLSNANVAVVNDKLTINLNMNLDSAYTINISVSPTMVGQSLQFAKE